MRRPVEFAEFPSSLVLRAPFGPYRGVAKHVVDGDTLDLLIDLGFNAYTYQTVRLRGIDAPEMYGGSAEEKVRGQASRAYLESLVPPLTPCVVTTWKDRQTFGRYVADITLESGDGLAELMVAAGHATVSI